MEPYLEEENVDEEGEELQPERNGSREGSTQIP